MRTTATNRKVRVLMTALKSGALVPNPAFQRRLVWSTRHKNAFIQTVLMEFPFPEIYIAAGPVDTATAEGIEVLVDGQQRVSTLFQYFTGSSQLKLDSEIRPYAALTPAEQTRFLEYDVVVRDLGQVDTATITEVFRRINSTRYALNAMEVHNARFEGALKMYGDALSLHPFFDNHHVFSTTDVKRMQDVRFALTVVITIVSRYFNRDDELETYLERFNDEFPDGERIRNELDRVFEFIEDCDFSEKSRAFQKSDLFTLVVELHRAIYRHRLPLKALPTGQAIGAFYRKVDNRATALAAETDVERYHSATVQASNDRVSRAARGEVIEKLLKTTHTVDELFES